jgi:hypothetical protein
VEPFKVTTAGDLEAVILAESFELLSDIVGPYMYRVSGEPGQQQAMFVSSELLALFYIRVHEFLADATDISRAAGVPSSLSLLSGGLWLAERYESIAGRAGLPESIASCFGRPASGVISGLNFRWRSLLRCVPIWRSTSSFD